MLSLTLSRQTDTQRQKGYISGGCNKHWVRCLVCEFRRGQLAMRQCLFGVDDTTSQIRADGAWAVNEQRTPACRFYCVVRWLLRRQTALGRRRNSIWRPVRQRPPLRLVTFPRIPFRDCLIRTDFHSCQFVCTERTLLVRRDDETFLTSRAASLRQLGL